MLVKNLPPIEGTLLDLRVPELSHGIVCVILRLAVLIEHDLWQTDGHTTTSYTALA